MNKKQLFTPWLYTICALFTVTIKPAASSTGLISLQEQLTATSSQIIADDEDLDDLQRQANHNALQVAGHISQIKWSTDTNRLLYCSAAINLALPPKSRNTISSLQGAATSLWFGIFGGALAYSVKRKPEHIQIGILMGTLPYLFYNLHTMLAIKNEASNDLLNGAQNFATKVGHAAQSLDETHYMKLLHRRLDNQIESSDMHEHLALEEQARLELLENLKNTTQSPKKCAQSIKKLTDLYQDPNHSRAEGAFFTGCAQLALSSVFGFYLGIQIALKARMSNQD